MKFTKFVKSLASEGVIYETNQILEKRWLASVSVLMAIPDTVRSVTASDIKEARKPSRESSTVSATRSMPLSKRLLCLSQTAKSRIA